MRTLHFIIALAATLTGCTSFAPQPALQMDSKTIAKSEKTIAAKKENPWHRNTHTKIAKSTIAAKRENSRHRNTHTKISKSTITAKMETPHQPDGKSNAELKKSIATKIETPQFSQLDDASAIKIAELAIAAKMENPASVVFLDLKRAARKDALGNSIDTICGHVRGKLAGDTGDRPFLYIVQIDEAYIGAYILGTTEYHICNTVDRK